MLQPDQDVAPLRVKSALPFIAFQMIAVLSSLALAIVGRLEKRSQT
jgi:hypothetical protein